MQAAGRIYLDTNIFIAAFEAKSDLAEKLLRLFSHAVKGGSPRFVTSEMTLAELMVMPFRRNDVTLITLYNGVFESGPWLDVQPATRAVFLKAAGLRARIPSRKLPDAVHMATAILSECTLVLSSDKGIRSQLDEEFPIAVLRPDAPTLTALLESLSA